MRYSQELTIPFFMVTEDGALSVANLVNLIQQTSERQLAGSASQTELVKQYNIGWVITQSQIEITRLPTAEEKVTVWTEATAYNRLLCYRDYGITDAAGNELVLVHSTWVMFDLTTRKIIPIIDELVAGFGAEKMTRVKRLPRLPHPEAFDGQRDYWVRYFDIDTNHHVNNVHYFEWMQDALGYEWLQTHTLVSANIKYEREVEPGSQLTSAYKVAGLESWHEVHIGETINATAHMVWRERN